MRQQQLEGLPMLLSDRQIGKNKSFTSSKNKPTSRTINNVNILYCYLDPKII